MCYRYGMSQPDPTNFDEILASPDHLAEVAASCEHLAHHLEIGIPVTPEDIHGLHIVASLLGHLADMARTIHDMMDNLTRDGQ